MNGMKLWQEGLLVLTFALLFNAGLYGLLALFDRAVAIEMKARAAGTLEAKYLVGSTWNGMERVALISAGRKRGE